MSLAKIWMLKALESQRRFAATRITHMFLEMDMGLCGAYCRTPALDAFDYTGVKQMYIVDHCPSSPETPRYMASGPAARQSHRAPTCTGCRFAWEAYVNWWSAQ